MFKIINIIVTCLLGSVVLIQVSKAESDFDTTIEKVPYMIQIFNRGIYVCDGVLVSDSHVVTRAEYINDLNANELSITAGKTKLTKSGVHVEVDKIILPPGYAKSRFRNDVAVLKLKSPVNGDNIRPIALCSKSWNPDTAIQVSGWSRLSIAGLSHTTLDLHTINVKAVDTSYCVSEYGRFLMHASTFCATAPSVQNGCIYYSCGAAVIEEELCGIVSLNVGCKDKRTLGIYTDLNKFKSFIENAIRE